MANQSPYFPFMCARTPQLFPRPRPVSCPLSAILAASHGTHQKVLYRKSLRTLYNELHRDYLYKAVPQLVLKNSRQAIGVKRTMACCFYPMYAAMAYHQRIFLQGRKRVWCGFPDLQILLSCVLSLPNQGMTGCKYNTQGTYL